MLPEDQREQEWFAPEEEPEMGFISGALAFIAGHAQAEILAATILKEVAQFILELLAGDPKTALVEFLQGLSALFPAAQGKFGALIDSIKK